MAPEIDLSGLKEQGLKLFWGWALKPTPRKPAISKALIFGEMKLWLQLGLEDYSLNPAASELFERIFLGGLGGVKDLNSWIYSPHAYRARGCFLRSGQLAREKSESNLVDGRTLYECLSIVRDKFCPDSGGRPKDTLGRWCLDLKRGSE